MDRPVRYFYEIDTMYHYLDEKTGDFMVCLAKNKDNKYNYFHLFKDDELSNKGLLLYQNKFNIWCDELYKKGGILYKKYYNHYSATELTFKRYSPNAFSINFDDVNFDEFDFIEKCYNGGIIYFNEQYKDKTVNSFGYDYSSFYPNILNSDDLLIPLKRGIKVKLNSIDFADLCFGIYKVKITCENPDFRKVFCFSKHHCYTNYSLQFAYKYKDIFKLKMELIKDNCEYNALIYKCDLYKSSYIFDNWFKKLFEDIKPKCSKNPLLKRLMSSLWGSLTKMEKCYFNETEVTSLDGEGKYELINEKHSFINGEIITRYECVKIEKPYKYHFARMKPFLLALSRNIIGELIIATNTIDKVIRIHTDGIVLNEEFDFKTLGLTYYPIAEDKTTGLIKWTNVNCYSNSSPQIL